MVRLFYFRIWYSITQIRMFHVPCSITIFIVKQTINIYYTYGITLFLFIIHELCYTPITFSSFGSIFKIFFVIHFNVIQFILFFVMRRFSSALFFFRRLIEPKEASAPLACARWLPANEAKKNIRQTELSHAKNNIN